MDRLGPYVIEDELGDGAMGTVYRVRHEELGAHYALKVLKPQLFQAVDGLRFKREMEALAAVSGVPGVVAIHTAGVDDGRPYYVMDLVEGEDLRSLLRREGMLDLTRAVGFVLELARTLAELHARGLIHRDVKPANVIIDEADKPRLADFGLSKAFADEASRLTATGEAIGTPLYMAPEQARGEPVGPPADVYALGMVLFMLVAGVPAVSGQTSVEILINANSGSHERLRSMAPRAPQALDELCHACFQPDPALRPSAFEVVTALEAFLAVPSAGQEAATAPIVWTKPLVLSLLLLCGIGVSVATLWKPRASGEGEAITAAGVQAWLETASTQLARAGEVDAGLEEEWRARRAATPAGGPLRVRMEVLGGELALRRGDLSAAVEALASARAVPSGPGIRDAQGEAVCLEAGIAAARGDPPGRVLSLLERAERVWAKRGRPPRPDLATARIRCLLKRRSYADAVKAISAAGPASIPAALRCEAMLLAGHLSRAEELLTEVEAPALVSRVRFALAEAALRNRDSPLALRHVRAGAVARDARLRERLGRLLEPLREELCSWERGRPRDRFVGMRKEIAYHQLRREIDPAYEMPEARVSQVVGKIFSAVSLSTEEEMLQLLSGFISLRPRQINSYDLFGRALSKNWRRLLRPHPERLEVLIQGRRYAREEAERARAAGDSPMVVKQAEQAYQDLTCWVAIGLHVLEREQALRSFVQGATEASAETQGYLAHVLACRLLLTEGGEAEAKHLLARARTLAPRSVEVLYAILYRQVQEQDRAAAKATGRALAALGLDPLQRRAGVLHGRAMSWQTFVEEEDGDLVLAAGASLAVCRRFSWSVAYSTRHAQLLLRVTGPPTSREEIVSAIRGIYVSFEGSRLQPPAGLRELARADDRERLKSALAKIAADYPAKSLLVHPAIF